MWQMIDISFFIFAIIESLKIDKKYLTYTTAVLNVVAVVLWLVLGGQDKLIPIALGVILIIKGLLKINIPVGLDKYFLLLTLVTLAPIDKSILFSILIISIQQKARIRDGRILCVAGLTLAYVLSLSLQYSSLIVPYLGIILCGLFIIKSYRANNIYSLLIWVLIQSKFSLNIFSHRYYYVVEIIVLAVLGFSTFLIWLEKRQQKTWYTFEKLQFLFVWFSTLQFGPVGFWISLAFNSYILEVISTKNGVEDSAMIKIKPTVIAIFYLLPISMPAFFLISTKNVSATISGAIATFLFLMVAGRWMRELKLSVGEKILDKWLCLDLVSILSMTILMAYRLIGGDLVGVITYAAMSVLIMILFMGLKLDQILYEKLDMPRLLLVTSAEQKKVATVFDFKFKQTNIINNIVNFAVIILNEFYEFIERNFLVVFLLVFAIVFFMGGGFA